MQRNHHVPGPPRVRARLPVRALAVLLVAWAPVAVAPAAAQTTPDGGDESAGSYPGNLPFYYDLYTFRGDGGETSVVAAFAVSAGELRAEHVEKGVRYRFDVSLVLADTAERSVSRTDDSVYVALPRALRRDHLLYTHIQVEAEPSRDIEQRVVMLEATAPGVGQLYHSPFPIRDYRGTDLMLSDVALAQPVDARDGWRRGDVTLALLPTNQFPSSSFNVYYEIYNLPHGHPYTTQIQVESLAGEGADDPVGLRFAGEALPGPDAMIPELRYVQASLPRGRYRLTVTVTDRETGRSVSGAREFHVRGWRAGETLVPAHPWKESGG